MYTAAGFVPGAGQTDSYSAIMEVVRREIMEAPSRRLHPYLKAAMGRAYDSEVHPGLAA